MQGLRRVYRSLVKRGITLRNTTQALRRRYVDARGRSANAGSLKNTWRSQWHNPELGGPFARPSNFYAEPF
jgi:hypothetical protein